VRIGDDYRHFDTPAALRAVVDQLAVILEERGDQ
jgi:hypothetical protein